MSGPDELSQGPRYSLAGRVAAAAALALAHSPAGIVLFGPRESVLYGNAHARKLLVGGERLEGHSLAELLDGCPAAMRTLLASERDGIFTVDAGQKAETYHVSQRRFVINRRPHALLLLRRLTHELGRQEAEIWKKVIRVLCHEMNNSLAPISSLLHSAERMGDRPDREEKLATIRATIGERVAHLTRFLEGYAAFARLPKPRKEEVVWEDWLEPVRSLIPFALAGDLPSAPGHFDPAQLQQALINLLKNAVEASDGSPEITLRIEHLPTQGDRILVLDRGRGMSDEVLERALLPFYSTKKSGSGVGLPLCREIVEAHGGTLHIQRRDGGGTLVSLLLPRSPSGRKLHGRTHRGELGPTLRSSR